MAGFGFENSRAEGLAYRVEGCGLGSAELATLELMKSKAKEVIDRELVEAVGHCKQGRQVVVLDEQGQALYQTGFPKKMTNELFEKLAAVL
jgi:sugar (pentulose or hexulose) kinase